MVTAPGSTQLDPLPPASAVNYFGRELYPASPLSWLAPLWYYGCGVLASGYWRSPDAAILPPFLGLVLVIPLLGTAWRGALSFGQQRLRLQGVSPSDPGPARFQLPYVLPSSAGQRFTSSLARIIHHWRNVRRLLELPLIELGVGCAGALVVAAFLGTPTLWLTLAGAVAAFTIAMASKAPADNTLATVTLPLLLCWLVALSLSGHFYALPVVTGLALAAGPSAFFAVERKGGGLLLQLAPQVLLVLCVLITGRLLAGLVVGLFAFAQVLWAPALGAADRRRRYFQSLQVPWATAMVVAALAVGTAL
ncbi:MAG TPA: hypothetical protein PKH89_06005 [Anaerolineae bacterium]|nr:hypothetical protein [Anaerolineae bacterium]